MKNIITMFIAGMVIVAGFSSCKKFLDETPTGSLTPGSNLTSPEIARAFANAAYAKLTVMNQGSGGYGGNTASLMEFMTGKAIGNAQSEAFRFYNLTYDSQSFYIDTWWQGLYQGIANCNLAIKQIAEIPQDEEVKKNQLAEAHALRAFYYFQLVRMYGPVPKITEIVTDLSAIQSTQSPVKEIYDEVILPDLAIAEASTLPWQDNTGKLSLSAVKSLLAEVYLTYAGFPVGGGATYYAESAKRSKEVIEKGGFSLFPEYQDMIKPANKNRVEFIWQVQYAGGLSNNPLTAVTLPQFMDIASYSDEYGGIVPTPQFIASYPAGDKRVQQRQYYYTRDTKNGTTDSISLGGHYIYKWYDANAVKVTAQSDLNYTIYRLADVMLLYAEASNRAEGSPNSDAIRYVNQIRERAKLAPIGAMTSEQFEREVWTQRYLELAFEGKIWFDMLRTRKVRNDVTKNFDDFVGHTNVFGKALTERQLLFPIPLREVNNNINLVQNPGF